MTRVAILNSRQSKTPVSSDPWVRATLDAVAHAAATDWTIVSSVGLNTWELVTWAAGRHGARLLLILPEDFSGTSWIDLLARFDLQSDKTEWERVPRGTGRSMAKNWWENRDAEIMARANVLIPVSIRPRGRLESLLDASGARMTERRFRVPYQPLSHHPRDVIDPTNLNPALTQWPEGYLIHWTRGCQGPWPGETESQFYQGLTASNGMNSHSALRTLLRILDEQRIRASSWRIGANAPMVAFTELSIRDSLGLMRWRPRWSRWSFEPYAIAITKNVARDLGAKPVQYVDEAEWRKLSEREKPYSHRRGRNADVWPAEREWRIAGDVELSSISEEALRIVTRHPTEQEQFAKFACARIVTMERG